MDSSVSPQHSHVPQAGLKGAFQSLALELSLSAQQNQVKGVHGAEQAYQHHLGVGSWPL